MMRKCSSDSRGHAFLGVASVQWVSLDKHLDMIDSSVNNRRILYGMGIDHMLWTLPTAHWSSLTYLIVFMVVALR